MTGQEPSPALIADLSAAYSIQLAQDIIKFESAPFSRVVERVEVDHSRCQREIHIEWDLPSFVEVLGGGTARVLQPNILSTVESAVSEILVPVILIRKGQLLNGLKLQNSDGSVIHICGRSEARRHTQLLLSYAWIEFAGDRSVRHRLQGVDGQEVERLAAIYRSIAVVNSKEADGRLAAIVPQIEHILSVNGQNVPTQARAALRRLTLTGRYFARRYFFWARITTYPGAHTGIVVTFSTRFAAEYGVPGELRHRFFKKLIAKLSRLIGQSPFLIRVPVSRHALTDSYHFELTTAEDVYISWQSFVLEEDIKQGKNLQEQADAFAALARRDGGSTEGSDEVGGSLSHLYVHKLPAVPHNQVYASIQLKERPPGTTSVAAVLGVFAAAAVWLFYVLWGQMVRSETQGIDIGAIFIALPGLGAVWFSRAFQYSDRSRVPIPARVALGAVGLGASYSLFHVLVRRGICSKGDCPRWIEDLCSRPFLLCVAIALSLAALIALVTRILIHLDYRRCQRIVNNKYGR
ncbi:hypothetical protein LWP59_33880 [Amycolatopsis acidiphila]|uniref:Uncharacterized protein n=1 Tax=Amycolatopsis acidiphila TaxID=715473 RepID=A0A558A8X2_9PSEU|nr:hypothetical protein [Amycolatopsis acidiphila]TVT20710.1 hypothetical protein FNH06_19535 [Amycolatopsis acidiphila]UIJ59012.1 hypothetical protein LWP59_33880 [Amycolatopsis acidiphila]